MILTRNDYVAAQDRWPPLRAGWDKEAMSLRYGVAGGRAKRKRRQAFFLKRSARRKERPKQSMIATQGDYATAQDRPLPYGMDGTEKHRLYGACEAPLCKGGSAKGGGGLCPYRRWATDTLWLLSIDKTHLNLFATAGAQPLRHLRCHLPLHRGGLCRATPRR